MVLNECWLFEYSRMRILMILVVVFLSCSSTPKASGLQGEWVAMYGWGGSEKLVGMVMNFKNSKQIILSAVGSGKQMNLTYHIIEPGGILVVEHKGKEEIFGYLKNMKEDQFVMMTPDSMQNVVFRRIRKTNLTITKEELTKVLIANSWTYKGENDSMRIDFMTTHKWDDERLPMEAIFHYMGDTRKELETWSVKEYRDELFQIYTNHQSNSKIHQIVEVTQDNISWTDNYEFEGIYHLKRKKKLSVAEKDKFKLLLTEKQWISTGMDTTAFEGTSGELLDKYDKDALTVDELNDVFEFNFKDDLTYVINAAGTEWKRGTWALTDDGEYICFDNVRIKENWILVRRSGKNLILSKLHKLKVGDWNYRKFMMTTTLE